VSPSAPRRVIWTDHALDKAALLAIASSDVERLVVQRHRWRRRNTGSADWRLTSGRLVILYNHPNHGDASAARIVTLWRQR
jgi:hypothetical protein